MNARSRTSLSPPSDARRSGVLVQPVSVQAANWDCRLGVVLNHTSVSSSFTAFPARVLRRAASTRRRNRGAFSSL